MERVFSEYVALLHDVQEQLEQLMDLTQQKSIVVPPDLEWMDKITYQEGVLMRTIQTWEQKREELSNLYMETSALSDCFPSAVQLETRQAIEELQKQYHAHIGESPHTTELEYKENAIDREQSRRTQYAELSGTLLENSQVDFHA